MTASSKRQVKASRHLVCGSCSNWIDFVKSGCEKSWTDIQAVSFECRGCAKMKGLEVEMERLRQFVVALVGREEVGCASGSSGGTVDDKMGEGDERDARESSPRPGRRMRGGKVTGRKVTGRKETGRNETGGKTMGGKEEGWKETGAKETGAMEMGEKEMRAKATGAIHTLVQQLCS